MASGSPNDSCNWLLVEWKSGGRDEVFIEAVVSPLNKDLKIDDMIVVNRLGKPEEAKLVARAPPRVRLAAMIRQSLGKASPPTAGPSMKRKREEETEDFCCSALSSVPSDDDGTLSADSDEIPKAKIKLERCKRQYSNKRTSKKIMTRSHRATPIIPKSMQQPTKMMNRKRSRNISLNKIKKIFKAVFKTIRKLKQIQLNSATVNHTSEEQAENLDQAPPAPMPYNETIQILNQTEPSAFRKTVEINSDHTELNQSGDNIIITNNLNDTVDAAVKTVQNNVPEDNEWVPIGSGKTLIHKDKFKRVSWKSYTIATRTLLRAVFSRRVLATHSLTGKKSPAFQDKPAKMCLDPKITADIINEVMNRFNVRENLVKSIITTKCADECKMWKNRHSKKQNVKARLHENKMPPPPPPPSPVI